MAKQQVLVLLSGGIDSTACIDFYLNQGFKVEALFVDYGQLAAKREKAASKRIAKHYDISLNNVQTKNFIKLSSGKILGRNAFLLSTALLNFKKSSGIIGIGIHSGTTYPDCNKKFITSMQNVFDVYKDGAIQIGVPFVAFNKTEIFAYSTQRDIPTEITYSCELGKDQPCGKCLSCKDIELYYESSKH